MNAKGRKICNNSTVTSSSAVILECRCFKNTRVTGPYVIYSIKRNSVFLKYVYSFNLSASRAKAHVESFYVIDTGQLISVLFIGSY